MRTLIPLALVLAALAAPAHADTYPVSGRWGQVTSTEKAPIDCGGKRVINFDGEMRTDSKGGVPSFRNKSVQPNGAGRWRVVDIFSTGQIRNGHANYTLHQIDDDTLEMNMQPGGLVKLQRCK